MVGSNQFLPSAAVHVFWVEKIPVFEAIHLGIFTRITIVAADLYDFAINYALYVLLFIFFFPL